MLQNEFQSPQLDRMLVRICGGVAACIGCTALLGWLLDLPLLASLGQGLIPMAPSGAMLFIVYGSVFLTAGRASGIRRATLLPLAIFAGGAVLAALLLALSLQGIYLDIEHFGMKAMGAVEGSPIGHMSPITAFTFLLFSLICPTVITAPAEGVWRAKAAWWTSVVLVAAYAMLLLAYLLGTPMFYGGRFIPPAATTSLAFIALGVALAALSQPLAWQDKLSFDRNGSYSFRTLAVIFVFLAAGIISAGYFYHRHHEEQYLTEVERQLSAVVDLKMSELLLWREERLWDADMFYNNSAFAALVKEYLRHPGTAQAGREIGAWVDHSGKTRDYYRIFLLDARNRVRLSFPEKAAGSLSSYVKGRAGEALQTGRITFADFYRNEYNGKIYLCILVPIFDPDDKSAPLAVLAMRIDPGKYLYPFLQRWPNLSTSAETLLVRREGNDVLFLNELRFRKDAAHELKIPLDRHEVPSVMAVMGQEGIVRGRDYRGKQVFAALRTVPDSPWHLVSKMDEAEIYAPLRERQWMTVLLVTAMLLTAGAVVGMVWRQQRASHFKHFLELTRRNEERLLCKEAELTEAQRLAHIGSWFWDAKTDATTGSDELLHIYGLDPATQSMPAFQKQKRRLYPIEDWERINAALEQTLKTGEGYVLDVVALRNGVPIWVTTRSEAVYGVDGQIVGLRGTVQDITEIKKRERELEQKNSEMERFAYTVSHDLRSPLVTVKSFVGFLEKDLAAGDSGRIAKDLFYMKTATDRMSQLLDQILVMSRVGKVVTPPVLVIFTELVQEVLELVAGSITEKDVLVQLVCDEPVTLYGDRPRLVEIWQNLIENAVKYMGDQRMPRVEIGFELKNGAPVFFVADNGMGIDPGYHARIFSLFDKLDPKSEGTGLGLALVKRIVEMYEGKIWVESAGVGDGSCFRFTLPLAVKEQSYEPEAA